MDLNTVLLDAAVLVILANVAHWGLHRAEPWAAAHNRSATGFLSRALMTTIVLLATLRLLDVVSTSVLAIAVPTCVILMQIVQIAQRHRIRVRGVTD